MRQLHRANLVLEQSITRVTDGLVIEAVVQMARVHGAEKRTRGVPESLFRSMHPDCEDPPTAGSGAR